MTLPDYWRTRPAFSLNPEAEAAFDALAETHRSGEQIDYTLPWPRWQFLCHLAERHGLLLHGSGNPAIAHFEPRPAQDIIDFGRQTAVYAAGDGLWAMFFAIVDRDRTPISVANACIRMRDPEGNISEPHYVFSVSHNALVQEPWRRGMVYVLPPDTFEEQASVTLGAYQIRVPQFASRVGVTPLARLEVGPEDFPLLSEIRPHDHHRLEAYAEAMRTGAPWPAGESQSLRYVPVVVDAERLP